MADGKDVILNYTPHKLNFYKLENNGNKVLYLTLPTQGISVRVFQHFGDTEMYRFGDVDIPLKTATMGDIVGLPDPEPGIKLVVSQVSALSIRGRSDVYFPSGEVRDGNGQIIGCTGLARFDQ